MVQISEQIRQIAQEMCDRIASLEPAPPSIFASTANTSQVGTPTAGTSSASLAAVPLSVIIDGASDAQLQHLLRESSRLRSEADAVVAATAGVIAKRSARELGQSGLAKRNGDHNAVDMVQRLTGSTRVEAARQVKLGEAMREADVATHPTKSGTGRPDDDGADGTPGIATPVLEVPWHEPLTRAVRNGSLKPEAVTIIMRGLGEPNERVSVEDLRLSAEQILEGAAGVNADELGRRARLLRDQIDPVGVRLRWDQHYENRKWRFSRSADGVRTAWVEFDDESAAYIDQLVGIGMRPRRGGPRMVDPLEAERAQELIDDPRSNDQLVFDLLMATIKAGVDADPTVAFGSRQPGVRVVITEEQFHTRDADGHLTGTGFNEDTGEAIPGNVIERFVCNTGIRLVTVDTDNNPLDVGREERLFTTKQRIGLGIRDGGCMFNDCTKPPSYTEAHHINEWAAEAGLTDIADGILVCHEDHMLLHNKGWKFVRTGTEYDLIPPIDVDPEQRPRRVRSKSTLKQAPPRARQLQIPDETHKAGAQSSNSGLPPQQRRAAPEPAWNVPDPQGTVSAPPPPSWSSQTPLSTSTSKPATSAPPPARAQRSSQASSPTPPRQAPGSPPGPSSPAGTSRPRNHDKKTDPPAGPRRRESNRRVMETWYVAPEEPSS
ncbi:DUF222 domain-containing protein [Mycetocola zhadangensis]|nr:DUF222 domain-containing protein [Mycetocola zhadangensis]GGE97507.1 hypothetical protein GCM10011313_20680 [Mycetocola zhadangensis]